MRQLNLSIIQTDLQVEIICKNSPIIYKVNTNQYVLIIHIPKIK